MRTGFRPCVVFMPVLLLVVGVAAWSATALARQGGVADGVLAGTVTSDNGPEAGVWVIAETNELETKFAKIVVTDDRGRFVLPQLPEATYDVWVRGYGLVDSAKVQLSPGREDVTLTGVVAPNEQAAAQYYPGNYWYSLIEPPPAHEFPGTGPDGNGIAENLQSQGAWVDIMKQGCQLCHQLGNTATRVVQHLDDFDSTVAAWDHRVQTGQRGNSMSGAMNRFGRQRALEMFADWTDRIAAGETAPAERRRAEPGRYAVGLGNGLVVHPRRDRDRQAQPDDQRRRAGLRCVGGTRQPDSGRPDREQRRRVDDPGAAGRSRQRPVALPADATPAVVLLGRSAALGARRTRWARELGRSP